METAKNNAVQQSASSEYLLYDSSRESNTVGNNVFSGALPKTTQKLLSVAIQSLKGFGFSGYTTRVFYKPTGYNGIARDTLRIEFSMVGSPAPGKVASELIEAANTLETVSVLDAI